MSRFTPGPWKMLQSRDSWGNPSGYSVWRDLDRPFADSPRGNRICSTPDGTTPESLANVRLIAAAPDLYAACDAADTAFAVLNVQDLGSQARACVREAWPLVQLARAKVYPDGSYAEVIKEAQEHEIKRLDGVVAHLSKVLTDLVAAINLDSDQEYFICSEAAPAVDEAIQTVLKLGAGQPLADHDPS